MFQGICKLTEVFPKEALQTFTSARGKEFACYQEWNTLESISILQMPMLHGNGEAMRIATDCCENSFLRKRT